MRSRALTLIGLAGLLALPIGASAASADSKDASATAGRGAPQLEIRFRLITREGEPHQLRRFRYRNLAAECAGDRTILIDGRLGTINVNDRRRFHKRVDRNGKHVVARGRVAPSGRRVIGTIRAWGDFAAGENCESGRVEWTAR